MATTDVFTFTCPHCSSEATCNRTRCTDVMCPNCGNDMSGSEDADVEDMYEAATSIGTEDGPGAATAGTKLEKFLHEDMARNMSPEWADKNWGKVRHVFNDDGFSFSDLRVVAGERCSLHFHEERANTFQCVDAQLIVEWWGPTNQCSRQDPLGWQYEETNRYFLHPLESPMQSILLGEGACLVIEPMIWHRFRVVKPGTLLELYFAQPGKTVRLDDIIRFDKGGPDR